MGDSTLLSLDNVLMDAIEEMIFIVQVDENGGFSYEFINKAAMLALRLDESALGKSLYDLHSAETANLLMVQYRQVLKTGESQSYEDSYDTYTAERRFSETRLVPFFNEAKACTHIAGIVKDITAEKAAKLEAKKAWTLLEESKSRYQSLFDHNTDAVFTVDLLGKIVEGNAAVEKMSGCGLEELVGSMLLDHLLIEGKPNFFNLFNEAVNNPMADRRIQFRTKSGIFIACLIKLTPIKIRDEIVGFYAILKDMTELDKIIGKYLESENLFRIIAENAHDVIILLNEHGQSVYASPSCEMVYGFQSEEVVAMPIFHAIHPEDAPELEALFKRSVVTGEPCKMQLRVLHKTKEWLWSELHGTPVFDEHNNFIHKVMILRDIEQQKDYQTKLEFFAYHDPLTELPNRRALNEKLAEELEKGQKFTVMLLDIDDFKKINDHWGHETGDNVIQEFGKRLMEAVDDGDIAARLGGDEFVVILKNSRTAEQAEKAADSIRRTIAKPCRVFNESLVVTTSIGIALAPYEGATVSSVLKKADSALYEAKKYGKNYYCISK